MKLPLLVQIRKVANYHQLFRCILILVMLIPFGLHVLVAQQTFEKCIGWIDDDYATGAVKLRDGTFVICGTTMDSITLHTDGIFGGVDTLGNLLWNSRFGDRYPNDKPGSVAETYDSKLISGGNEGNYAFFAKWDGDGGNLWKKKITISNALTSVISTSDSAYAYCGASYYQILVCKTDTAGTVIWQKFIGGPGYEHRTNGNCIIQNLSGGYVVCGSKTHYPHPGTASFVAGLKPDGSLFWQQTHGELEHTEIARQIKQTPDNGYLYCGFHSDSYMYPTNGDGIVVKTNSGGQALWSKIYSGSGDDYFNAFDTTVDGGYVFCGKTTSYGSGGADIWLVCTNASGDTLWTRTYGGPYDEEGVAVITMPDGGFFLVGSSNSFWNSGFDLYLIRTDKNGMVEDPSRTGHRPSRTLLEHDSMLPGNKTR